MFTFFSFLKIKDLEQITKDLMHKIIIIGSGGHARSCLDVIREEKNTHFTHILIEN